jgi:hypothetical protein
VEQRSDVGQAAPQDEKRAARRHYEANKEAMEARERASEEASAGSSGADPSVQARTLRGLQDELSVLRDAVRSHGWEVKSFTEPYAKVAKNMRPMMV